MKRIVLTWLLPAAVALALGAAASADTARRWIQGGREEFLRGSPESASITSDGRIMLPPQATKLFDSPQQFVWDMAVDATGQLFVAGGNEGTIYDGRGTPVHDDEKPEIHALAVGPDNMLYFATSPLGAVYRLAPGGTVAEFFTPRPEGGLGAERYIWDLAFDGDGNLYVATGIEGRLYQVGRDGAGRVVFDSDEAHISCLAVDASGGGRVLFGSDPNGQVFSLDAEGNVFVLFDSTLKEINNLAVGPGGALYATGVGAGAVREVEPSPQPRQEQQLQEVPAVSQGTPQPGSRPAPLLGRTSSVAVAAIADGSDGGDGEVSAVYRILPDNTVETVWSSDELVAYSLALDRGGRALVGTGPRGLLIAIEPDGTERVLRRLQGRQVTALLSSRGQLHAGVSNLGRVYRLSEQFDVRGEFLSQVKDTGTVSTFGAIRWRAEAPAGTTLRLLTRSGNTAEPDNTWSAWSEPYSDPRASTVASPAARFVQWKAELSTTEPGASPLLSSVSIFYLQNNLRPRVRTAAVLPVGIHFQPAMVDPDAEAIPAEVATELRELSIMVPGTTAAGKMVFARQMRTIRWEAADPNGDELTYRVLYRPIESSEWSALTGDHETSLFSFDTRSLADGTYVARIEASDIRSNTPERAKTGHLDTQPFDVDNTPPRIEDLAATADGGEATVTFTAADDLSAIKRIRLRVDAGRWRVVLPEDGIPDSGREQVAVRLQGLAPGAHTVTVQAMDELYNVGAGRAVVTVR